MYQLRTYVLANDDAAKNYFSTHWKRHLESLPKFGITVHNVFQVKEPGKTNEVMALVSYEEGVDIAAQNEKYMQSPEFRKDMEGFDMTAFVGVSTILLSE